MSGATRSRREQRLPAALIYLIISGGFGLFFALITTVNLIYQFKTANLNPFQLVLVGTVLETVAFLCEVPTGIVADVYSRRLSIVIGYLLVGIGFVIEGLFPRFDVIVLCQVIWGIGITFTSGATEAWLADEVGETTAARLYLRGQQVYQFGGLIGVVLSVALASVRINVPIVVGGALITGLGIFLALTMPEHGFTPTPREERNSFQQMGHTFIAGLRIVRTSPVLITILLVIAFRGAASEALDRLWQAHLLENFTFPTIGILDTIAWFGLLAIIGRLISIGSTALVGRRVDTSSHHGAARAVLVLNSVQLVGMIGLGIATNFGTAVAAYFVVTLCRITIQPVFTAWMNQSLEPRTRATVLSFAAQSDAIGQIAGGPALGYVGKAVSLRAALVAAGCLLAPALLLLLRSVGRQPVSSPALHPAED